jgi:hypothetical protein
MEVKRADTIEYRPSVMADSEYKITKLFQNTGANSVTISSSESVATIELPAVAMNLAQSYLNFSITVPANTNAAKYSIAYRDTPPISRLELFTRGGKYLMDISNFSNVYQAFGQRTKMIEDYHGSADGIITKTSINELETERFVVAGDGTTAAPAVVNFKIPGHELYNTVLSLDKSIWFGEVLQLRITFGAQDSVGFWADDYAENAIPTLGPVITTPVSTGASPITLTNLNFFLAQEQNPRVVNDLMQTVSTSGMSLVVPFVHSYKTSATAADTAVSIRLSRGHGQSVERIYTIPINGAESFGTRYVADAEALVSFYSLLDSRRLQEFDVLCGGATGAHDYLWLRAREKQNRVVSLTADNDEQNFAWSDSWCDGLECAKKQHLGGLDLSVERKYDIYFKSTVATTKYYSAVVCQKMLSISPAGVEIM